MKTLMTIVVSALSLVPSLGAAQASSRDVEVPAGLGADEWSCIRQAYEASRYAAHPDAGGFLARNPGQRWHTRFDGRGFTVRPDAGAWSWGLELARYGFAGEERAPVRPASVGAEGRRVAYAWDDVLEEWYVNDARGLEHGYTVHRRPPGGGEPGPLRLTLAVRGELAPRVQAGGRGARFVAAGGAAVLTYAGLAVFDADGRVLPARLERVPEGLRLSIDERGARYPLTIDPLAQQAYLKASDTDPDDAFGTSVAVSGDTVVVGAPGEASSATGVDGDASDDGAPGAGAAYVFVRSGAGWSQQAYLKASNTGVNGDEGDDGAVESGAAYVFVRSGSSWSQQAYLKASNTDANDFFGWSVAVSGDTAVVGAWFESSSATGVDGDASDNSAAWSGAAYVFARSGTSWSQEAYLKASNTDAGDWLGHSVAVSGDTVVVGARGEDGGSTGVNADEGDDGAAAAGAAYVFVRGGTGWSQQAYLKASNTDADDRFGFAVAVSGDTAVVGAYGEDSGATGVDGDQGDDGAPFAGAAYVFARSGTSWSQEAYLKATDTDEGDAFGWSVAVSGPKAVVTAPGEDSSATGVDGDASDDGASFAGAAYTFVRSGASWSEDAYLKASNTDAGDWFGSAVAASGPTVVVGAFDEDSGTTGVDGDASDDGAPCAGAAYVLDPCAEVVAASEAVVLGSPPNPHALLPGQTSGPVVGSTWDPRVDHTSFVPHAVLDALFVQRTSALPGAGAGLLAAPFTAGSGAGPSLLGTLLCDPWSARLTDRVPAGTPFAIELPASCTLVGTRWCAQAASVDAHGTIRLTNALDVTIGTF